MLHLQGTLSNLQTTLVNSSGILAQIDPSAVVDTLGNVGVKSATNPEGLVWAALATALSGGVAWFYNRRMKSGDALADATNDFKVDTLKDAREQIDRLTTEVISLRKANTEMFEQLRANNTTMLQSEAAAERMRNEAAIASAAAMTAKDALDKTNRLMEEIRGLSRAQAIYIFKLQETMRANGVSFEPFAEPVSVTPR